MTRYLLYCLLALMSCAACNSGNDVKQSLTHQLPSEYFTVDIRADTLLQTAKGTRIHIPAGAISSKNGHTIKLEVKEAYSIADIVKAGLFTQSNGQPLSSGGMLFINPVGDPGATIVKPIDVQIPTDFITKGMELFKGEWAKDSSINWTNPTPLIAGEEERRVDAGNVIFQQNCTSCHAIDRKLAGPPLLHTTARHSFEWLEDYIVNSAAVLASGDCYANHLFDKYNKTPMTSFPNLRGADMHDLLAYIDNESKRINKTGYDLTKRRADSCAAYLNTLNALHRKRRQLVAENGAPVRIDPGTGRPPQMIEVPDNMVAATSSSAYYNFEMETFGWFNVDILLKGIPGYENSNLRVRITGTVSENTQVFMIIPDDKIYLIGGLLAGSNDEYGFFTKDGNIPLPQKKKAYIMATGETNGVLLFGTTVFETSLKQELTITLAPSDKPAFNNFTRQLEGNGFSMKVVDTRHATDIRATDELIKAAALLKPVGLDCGCDNSDTSTMLPQSPAPAPGR
ncbi:cytochrome c [Chitinophaga sp.]|uniref:c-type cytochrome n=1 Tax=Chitinophaga sp. TaxID=1869181 RepID=UPI002F94D7A6